MVFVCLLLLFSLSFIFTVSLNNPSGKKKITDSLMPIHFCLCYFVFSHDLSGCKGSLLAGLQSRCTQGSLSIIVHTSLHRSTQTTFLSSLIAIEPSTVGPQHFRRHHIYMDFYLWVALQNVLTVKRALLDSGHKSIPRQYELNHMGSESLPS